MTQVASATTPAPDLADVRHEEGVRETIESIVIALILAFVFRAFIVEAFRIPTGSMAPTLYGAHGKVICTDCGVEFAYGVRDPEENRHTLPVRRSSHAVCPNCNHVNTNLRINDEFENAEGGDRILVLKWPLDLGAEFFNPKRWEVTVFKDPSDGETNFIKRLVGVPNEVLMILDGDIYVAPTEELSVPTLEELRQIVHEKYLLREGLARGRLRPVSDRVRAELDEKMRIARKSNAAQRILWFGVYDHDHPPRDPDRNQPRWEPARAAQSGWDTSNRRVHFQDRGLSDDYIELHGKPVRATNAYNVLANGLPPLVSDQRVRFVLTPEAGQGRIHLRLEKHKRTFWATVDFDGTVSLTESTVEPTMQTPALATANIGPLAPGRPVEVSFEHLDFRLALRVGGKEVLATSDDPASPGYYAPDLAKLRSYRAQLSTLPRIYAQGGNLSLIHLIVERDVHYFTEPHSRLLDLSWAPEDGWATPDCPVLLRENEYFMLGDNTAASKDARLWDRAAASLRSRGEAFQLGTVPRDQLIGEAFFVYWPAGHRLEWLPIPPLNRIGIIPDVGKMRWIR
jgi:signal peptidase I